MTIAARSCLGIALGLVLGCQRGQASAPPPIASTAPAEPALATPAPEPTVGPMLGPPAAPAAEPGHVTLPRSPNTPPHRTTRPLARKELQRLAAIAFKDFDREDRGLTPRSVEVRHTTQTRPKLGVTVSIEPCPRLARGKRPVAARAVARATATTRQVAAARLASTPAACTPMALDAWKARGDELKQFLSKELVARPDTRFEIGVRELLDLTAIYTYQLGYYFGKDERDQPVGDYSNAYILYYNDGVNQIRVNAHYRDDALGGRDQLVAVAPREDLEKLAVAFMNFYLHEWK